MWIYIFSKYFIRDEISIFISCTVIFSLYFYFYNIPIELALSPLYTTYFDQISLYIYNVSLNIFYNTKSKVTGKTFKSNFTWRCNLFQQKNKSLDSLDLFPASRLFRFSDQDEMLEIHRGSLVTCFFTTPLNAYEIN